MNTLSFPAPGTPPPVQPWCDFATRVEEAFGRRSFFIASSVDLGVLWRDERIDATERRRRITVLAAQHRWKVDIRGDGRAARFERTEASARCSAEILRRNHE